MRLGRLALVALLLSAALSGPAAAQDPTSTTGAVGVPSHDIVPEPDSGEPPEDAGDRGGPLQLGLLVLVVLVIAGAVLMLVRQSRQARGA